MDCCNLMNRGGGGGDCGSKIECHDREEGETSSGREKVTIRNLASVVWQIPSANIQGGRRLNLICDEL